MDMKISSYHKVSADSALNTCLYHNPCRCEMLPNSVLSPHCEQRREHHKVPVRHLGTDLLCQFLVHSQSFLGRLSNKGITIVNTKI